MDRSCDGRLQFRLELHKSMHVAFLGLGVKSGHLLTTPTTADPNGWGSVLTSMNPLRPLKESHICLPRTGTTVTLQVGDETVSAENVEPVVDQDVRDMDRCFVV